MTVPERSGETDKVRALPVWNATDGDKTVGVTMTVKPFFDSLVTRDSGERGRGESVCANAEYGIGMLGIPDEAASSSAWLSSTAGSTCKDRGVTLKKSTRNLFSLSSTRAICRTQVAKICGTVFLPATEAATLVFLSLLSVLPAGPSETE